MFVLMLNGMPVFVSNDPVALFVKAQNLFGGAIISGVEYYGRCSMGTWIVRPVQVLEDSK